LPQLTDAITGVLQAFTSLDPGTQSFIIAAAAIAAVVGPIVLAIGAMVSGIGLLIPAIAAAIPVIDALVAVAQTRHILGRALYAIKRGTQRGRRPLGLGPEMVDFGGADRAARGLDGGKQPRLGAGEARQTARITLPERGTFLRHQRDQLLDRAVHA
jgi:hypothetical protein